jgi:DNA-binding NarL/FixJ family response regulator
MQIIGTDSMRSLLNTLLAQYSRERPADHLADYLVRGMVSGGIVFAVPTGGVSAPLGRVSSRQLQILGLCARGMTYEEIAADIGCAPSTVCHHLEKARPAMRARNTTHAVAMAMHDGLIDIGDGPALPIAA